MGERGMEGGGDEVILFDWGQWVFPLFQFFDFKIDLSGLLGRFGIIVDRFVQYI